MSYAALEVKHARGICQVTLARPEANNALDDTLIAELGQVVADCEDPARGVRVLVLRGQPEVFCAGGDLDALVESGRAEATTREVVDPAPLYDLWLRLGDAPFVSVCAVRGRVNAGGVGLVAACDLTLAAPDARFSLSELLFGLLPACVLPFLIRRVGPQRAHYLTLSTAPISAAQALDWGLVDALTDDLEGDLRRHLLRLRRLERPALQRYKRYRAALAGSPQADRALALDTNRAMFADETVRANLRRYAQTGRFPWET